MKVKYEAYTWAGGRVTGVIEAETEASAYENLKREQLFPLKLQVSQTRRSLVQILPSLFQPSNQIVVDFTRQLSTLVRSGVPIRTALIALRDQTRSAGLREALRQIIQDIEAGARLSTAIAKQRTVFPRFYVRLLQVAEASGELGVLLGQMAQVLERQKALKQRVRSALLYPALTLGISALALTILVTYSLPALLNLISSFGGELPASTRLLLDGSAFIKTYAFYGVGFVLLFVAVCIVLLKTKRGTRTLGRFLLAAPIVKQVTLLSNLFGLMSTLGTLLRSGVSTTESLRLAGREASNAVIRDSMEEVEKALSAGESLSQAFSKVSFFPSLVVQAMRSGEMTGTLPQVVDGLTEYYEKESERNVGLAVELITPVVTLLVAGLVGFVAVAVMSGIYSTLGSIQ